MNKKRIAALLALALLIALLALAGCSGTTSMLMGRWSMTGIGDANGENSQSYPLPVVVDVYPDGHVDMLDKKFGTYTRDRDTYTFKGEEGTGQDKPFESSGSFKLVYPDSSNGLQAPTLTIFPDDAPVSYIFEKQMDLPNLKKYLQSSAAAAAAPTPAPAASPTPASSEPLGPEAPSASPSAS